jgi:hypothetical protein
MVGRVSLQLGAVLGSVRRVHMLARLSRSRASSDSGGGGDVEGDVVVVVGVVCPLPPGGRRLASPQSPLASPLLEGPVRAVVVDVVVVLLRPRFSCMAWGRAARKQWGAEGVQQGDGRQDVSLADYQRWGFLRLVGRCPARIP